jgi:hypothetical protein
MRTAASDSILDRLMQKLQPVSRGIRMGFIPLSDAAPLVMAHQPADAVYLYLIIDIYSRKIVGWWIAAEESMDIASKLIERATREQGVPVHTLALHADNGGPMKGSTMLATLHRLGVLASFSRPRVSDDNPYAEAAALLRSGRARRPRISPGVRRRSREHDGALREIPRGGAVVATRVDQRGRSRARSMDK